MGRPKLRWEVDVKKDIQRLKLPNWKTLVQDRRRWKEVFGKAVVTKSGNINFLEPSGPLRACNGTALPFTFTALICTLVFQSGISKFC